MNPIIRVTDANYAELVQQAGYTLVFIDSEEGYGGRDGNRRLARKLAREQADCLRVVHVIKEECPVAGVGYGPGTFLLFQDGKKLSGTSLTNRLVQLMPWLVQWCPRLASEG
jgi:hypothetical protein